MASRAGFSAFKPLTGVQVQLQLGTSRKFSWSRNCSFILMDEVLMMMAPFLHSQSHTSVIEAHARVTACTPTSFFFQFEFEFSSSFMLRIDSQSEHFGFNHHGVSRKRLCFEATVLSNGSRRVCWCVDRFDRCRIGGERIFCAGECCGSGGVSGPT